MESQNVTLRLPRSLLRRVKVLAAERDTSISALLARSLEDLVGRDDRGRAAAERLLERAGRGFDLGTRGHLGVSRADLHDR